MKKIKKGDPVVVIAGKHKGKISTVMKVADQKVYLDGVNVAKKAVK
jgi:large subunit ribosomal protein L24